MAHPRIKATCADCLLRKGSSSQARSITIPVHGSKVGRALTVVQ